MSGPLTVLLTHSGSGPVGDQRARRRFRIRDGRGKLERTARDGAARDRRHRGCTTRARDHLLKHDMIRELFSDEEGARRDRDPHDAGTAFDRSRRLLHRDDCHA